MDDEAWGRALDQATISSLLTVALVAAKTYDRVENPGRYGDEGSFAQVLEWFPKLEEALADAGLLNHQLPR